MGRCADGGCGAQVQRILMELLNQMDGFDQTVNVKVIMATNRADTLDPALLRPGRLDRKIEFPLPDRRQKRLIFQVRCSCHLLLARRQRPKCWLRPLCNSCRLWGATPAYVTAVRMTVLVRAAGMHEQDEFER